MTQPGLIPEGSFICTPKMARALMQLLPVSEVRSKLSSNTLGWEYLSRISMSAFSDTAVIGNEPRYSTAIQKDGNKTVGQVARDVGLSERTVRLHIEENRLPAEKIGRTWVITAEDAATYASTHRRT